MARTPWKNVSISLKTFPGRCSCEFCEIAKKLTLDFKTQLSTWLSTDTQEFFQKFFFFNANSKSEKNLPFLHHVSI